MSEVEETKAERKMKSDIANVVDYFEESDLTDEELINLSKDMERISRQFSQSQLQELREALYQELEEYGIPKEGSFYINDVLAGLNPQEIGEVKSRLHFLDLIDQLED